MAHIEQIDFGGLTVYVDKDDPERFREIISPFLESIKKLRDTVGDYHPHWLDDSKKPPFGYDDSGLKGEYLRITGLLESVCPELYLGIQEENIEILGMVAYELLDHNSDPKFCIRLGSSASMMNSDIAVSLGSTCAECLYKPDADSLSRSITKAMTNVVDRLQMYIDPTY